MKLSRKLSERVFEIRTEDDLVDWLHEADKELAGISWVPLGNIPNNVHTVEVASDPALALVERPTNSIDALLDLKAREQGETAPSPHEAAKRWWKVPAGGLSGMKEDERRYLADNIRVTMVESDVPDRPTIVIQDCGTGQHPDDFPATLLSLLASNKKGAMHLMGVFNAGGAACYKFAKGAITVSRLAPSLLDGRPDEIGVSVVRHNPLDPEKFKSGVYEYAVAKDKSIIRLGFEKLPDLEYGTYVKLVEYQLAKYARGAHEPKQSLWHLFHAALPDPALPFRIIETRAARFPGMKGKVERRVVTGLLHLLGRKETAEYSDIRSVDFGPTIGRIALRYFVLNEGTDPEAYVTSEQALTITLNGQRQITKDRAWLKRHLELFYIIKRLIVVVDGTGLTSSAKREVFSSTRETGVDSPLTKRILDRVAQELYEDENLVELDEQARQRTLEAATKTTTEKVKKALASQVAAFMKGELGGGKGGHKGKKPRKRKRRKPTGKPRSFDDSMMLDVPDTLKILTDPLEIEPGDTAGLRLEINAKNDFLPKYADGLSVVFGPEVKDQVKVVSKGRLLGGRVRVTVEASPETPIVTSSLKVALVVQELGVLLTAEGKLIVSQPKEDEDEDKKTGGEPNIDIRWVGRDRWDAFTFDEEAVGVCNIYREDPNDKEAITKVEWILNEAFAPYEKVVLEKKLGETALKTFKENYEYPVAFALFKQRLAEEAKEREADDEGKPIEIPDDYVRGENARTARAVLMAMEPEMQIAEVAAA